MEDEMSFSVLWVEEEAWTLRFERRLAEARGWTMFAVESAAEARKLASVQHFDAIIVDLNIPSDEFNRLCGKVDIDAGFALIKSIRSLDPVVSATLPDLPLLVITAVASPERKAKVCEYLASSRHYLHKPLVEAEYESALSELHVLMEQRSATLRPSDAETTTEAT